MLVSKINYDIHFAFHFLPIDKDIVTPVRNLGKKNGGRKKINESPHKLWSTSQSVWEEEKEYKFKLALSSEDN